MVVEGTEWNDGDNLFGVTNWGRVGRGEAAAEAKEPLITSLTLSLAAQAMSVR